MFKATPWLIHIRVSYVQYVNFTLPIPRALRCSVCILTKWVLVSLLLWVFISPTSFQSFCCPLTIWLMPWWPKKSSLLKILDEHIVWILMHHPSFLPLWIILTIDLFLMLTTFGNFQGLVFWRCHLSPVGDLIDANDGKRELTENIWRPSYTCLRHILSTLPCLYHLTIYLASPPLTAFL